jgi:hypothetical protein
MTPEEAAAADAGIERIKRDLNAPATLHAIVLVTAQHIRREITPADALTRIGEILAGDAPPPVDRAALEQLAASWQQREAEFRDAAKRDPMAEITEVERCQTAIAHHFGEHARQLLDAIGAKP